MKQARQFGGEADASVVCDDEDGTVSTWPLTETLRIERRARPDSIETDAIS